MKVSRRVRRRQRMATFQETYRPAAGVVVPLAVVVTAVPDRHQEALLEAILQARAKTAATADEGSDSSASAKPDHSV